MEKIKYFYYCIFFLSFGVYSQIAFEKGYYINNSNQKIECFIKNMDWGLNPTSFEYKTLETDPSTSIGIESVKEFSIHNAAKYIRKTVNIDQSSEEISKLSTERNPLFIEDVVFLKVLVEGNANLYYYENRYFVRFFYGKDNSNVEQLVYKTYKTSNSSIEKNVQFKQQLWTNLKCPTTDIARVNQLEYEKKNLINFFIEYNRCNNSESKNYEVQEKRDAFNLSLRAHFNTTSLTIQNSVDSNPNTDFGSKLGIGVGVEAEIILPFNKNKWSLVIEPTYQSFKSEKKYDATLGTPYERSRTIDYKSIKIPLSLRHYFFLQNDSKIFINASYIIDVPFDSSIESKRIDNNSNAETAYFPLEISRSNNFGLGIGYKFKDKYSVEMRYHSNSNILSKHKMYSSDYNKISVIVGYSIF